MPDRSYYLGNDSTSVALRGNYTQHMKNLFQLLKGVDSPSLDPSTVLEVETKLAQIFVPRTDLRDPYKTNSMRTLGEIKQMVQQFDWDIYFNILRSDVDNDVLTQGRINVYTMSYFEHLGQLLNSVSLEDWKTYLAWHLVSSNAYLLSSEFREENERWGKILTGQNQGSPRWKQCTSLTQNLLGFIVGHHFVQAHFSNGSKEVALELVRNIKSTFSESITKLDWMDDETKQQAITKLNKIENMIGYPDKWPTYEYAHVQPHKLFESVKSLRYASVIESLSKVGKRVDKSEWQMFPQDVNAYYSSDENLIAFPAGILIVLLPLPCLLAC